MMRIDETENAGKRYSKVTRHDAPDDRKIAREVTLAVAVIASGLTMGVLTLH